MLFRRSKEEYPITDIDRDDGGSFYVKGKGTISLDRIKELEKKFALYCLRIESIESIYVSESDDADIDLEPSQKDVRVTSYHWLRVKKNSAYLARYQDEVIGVVFFVREDNVRKGYVFSFDGTVAQGFYTGYRGSYRTHLFGIESLTLTPIEKGMKIKEIGFELDGKTLGI
ncbi:MAG: hypothetical protein K6B65_03705 [Bacilli bacterium]|nr:hypothetical protein [Bacilli bacterium]